MAPRVLELSRRLDPQSRAEAEPVIAQARAQALRLRDICSVHARRLESARAQMSQSRSRLRSGSQLLQSLKPIKNNYPKFIDSMG